MYSWYRDTDHRLDGSPVMDPRSDCDIATAEAIVGYISCNGMKFIPLEDAYTHALGVLAVDPELQRELVEWFYSGNHLEVTREEAKRRGIIC